MTIAWIQRFTTLLLIGLALLWATVFVEAGLPVLALIGAVAILLGYAVVLAFEFATVYAVHGDDPAPPASAWQLARAWWHEACESPRIFCWDQPFRTHACADFLPAHMPGEPPVPRGVVLVHGYLCNRAFWNPWMRRLRTLGVPHVAVTLQPPFGSISKYTQTIDAAVRRLEEATGLAPVVLAHSMGGLAARAWLADHQAYERVHQVITIGTPHGGTWLARLGSLTPVSVMRLKSDWLWLLMQREPAGAFKHFTCFYSHCDNVVFPASTATLAGARNRHLEGMAHIQMAASEQVFETVRYWLSPMSG